MPSHYARAALRVLLLLALGALADEAGEAGEAYSLLDPNTLCSSFLVPDVPSAADCFEKAAPFVNLTGKLEIEVPGLPFKGCVYNTEADMVFFGTGQGGVATGTFRYLCVGIATTVTETATTASTVETTTTTQTLVPYTMLDPDTSCATFLLPEVTDEEECFLTAATTVFPGGQKSTYTIPGMPFYGCVYMAVADIVLFNAFGDGSSATTSANLQQICRGIPTTTTQTTTETITETLTGTTTVTQTESETTTMTVTTVTRTTATQTTETSTAVAVGDYTMLEANMLCSTLSLPLVTDKDECFEIAAPSVSLPVGPPLALSGMPFDGCVYNADAGLVLFGSNGVGVAPSPSIRPICRSSSAAATATATETTTAGPPESSTTSTSLPGYSLLALGTICAGPVSSVPSQAECFEDAAQSVGLGTRQTLVLTGHSSFGGCVYSPALGYVMWNSEGSTDVALPYVQPICKASADGGASTTDTTTYVMV